MPDRAEVNFGIERCCTRLVSICTVNERLKRLFRPPPSGGAGVGVRTGCSQQTGAKRKGCAELTSAVPLGTYSPDCAITYPVCGIRQIAKAALGDGQEPDFAPRPRIAG